jgi:hypothetical protein
LLRQLHLVEGTVKERVQAEVKEEALLLRQ